MALHRVGDSLTAGNEMVQCFEEQLDHNVSLYDETLRDGEQTPGVSLSDSDKIRITERLLAAGLRNLTLGFPASSENELRLVRDLQRLTEGKAETWCVSR